jgi:hypothetical protein
MYHNDHGVPHFHAKYGDNEASIAVATLEILDGRLSTRTMTFVRDWAAIHKEELLDDWRRAREQQPLLPIEPLE